MILTVTLNPAIDLFLEVEELVHGGEVNRPRRTWRQVGGKGINVSRALHALGMRTTALLTAGADSASVMSRLLAREVFPVRTVAVPGETRVNVHILDRSRQDSIKVNQSGAAVPDALESVREPFTAALNGVGMVVLSGSLPAESPVSAWGELAEVAAARRLPVLVDAEGPALLEALKRKPSLAKFNRQELEATMGRRLDSEADIRSALEHLRTIGTCTLIVTDGGRCGWSLEPDDRFMRFVPPPIVPIHTNGAGDAFTAGLSVGLRWGWELRDSLRLAMAAGAAQCLGHRGDALSSEVENLIGRGQVETVTASSGQA